MKQRQFLFPQFEAPKVVHGGEHSLGKRKTKRPLSTKKVIGYIKQNILEAQGLIAYTPRKKNRFHVAKNTS